MKWFWFPIAVVATSIALVVALGTIFLFPVRVALASGLGVGAVGRIGPWHGGSWGPGSGFVLPTQVQGLLDLPPSERFSHFEGVQINLKDKDNRPLLVTVTPGKVTATAATSLTIAANDGTSKTFAIDSQTMVRGRSGANDAGNPAPFATGDAVVVVALNNSTTATAVLSGDHGFGPPGPGNGWGPFSHAQ